MLEGRLRKIGNCLGLREAIDPEKRVTKHIRAELATVDIIPVDYALNLEYVAKRQDDSINDFAIAYDFDNATNNYAKRCINYGLKAYHGVQLWLTDDTQAYEEITSSFENNMIESGVNQFGQRMQGIRGALASANLGATINNHKIPGVADDVIDGINSGLNTILGAFGVSEGTSTSNTFANITKTIADVVLQGKIISLPKIWKQSDYNPSVTFNVKLVSPYGSPEAIKQFIVAPLVHLLLLVAPESRDGLSYGLFQPLKIKAYGISNINLGAISSISLRRGGRETAYNVYKQPLQVDVGLNVIPLTSGFAFIDGLHDVATMHDAAKPYSENASGSPAITTVGNIIQSFRPAPSEIVNQNSGNLVSASMSVNSRQDISLPGIGSLWPDPPDRSGVNITAMTKMFDGL